MTPDQQYAAAMVRLGYQLDEFKIGGNYTPLLRDGNHVYISGQIPRVGAENGTVSGLHIHTDMRLQPILVGRDVIGRLVAIFRADGLAIEAPDVEQVLKTVGHMGGVAFAE
ncbi:hypothetical protein [Pseudomonas sp. Bout1]|uniref:hypothetical protein n=1 Tax=Pseudomonas sp. Bout1 TaxID=3048600 RepID=UPI0039FD61C9